MATLIRSTGRGDRLRLLGSLKGPLPQALLAPVPTPAGDASGAYIALWLLDGPVWAAILGAALAALASVSVGWAALAALAALGLLVSWASYRLGRNS